MQSYQDELTIVGTPVYCAPGCEGPTYRSALIVPISCNEVSLESLLRSHVNGNIPLVLGANSIDSFSVGFIHITLLSVAIFLAV